MKSKQKGSLSVSKIALGVLRVASFLGGLVVLAHGVLAIGFGQCHDSGGFCAVEYDPELYVMGAIAFLIGGLMLGFSFTRNIAKIGMTGASFCLLAVLWAIASETAR